MNLWKKTSLSRPMSDFWREKRGGHRAWSRTADDPEESETGDGPGHGGVSRDSPLTRKTGVCCPTSDTKDRGRWTRRVGRLLLHLRLHSACSHGLGFRRGFLDRGKLQ